MNKILSFALVVVALSTPADAKAFNGFYGGIDFGLASMNTRATGNNVNRSIIDRTHGTANRPNLGLFLGYNKAFSNCLTLGGVFTSDFNLTSQKNFVHDQQRIIAQKRETFSWGLLATVGALVNPKSMVLVGLGIKSLNNKYIFRDLALPKNSFHIKNNKIRFTSQIGHETLLANNNIALRVTYGFTLGSTKRVSSWNGNFYGTGGALSYKTHEHQVKLGMSYRF